MTLDTVHILLLLFPDRTFLSYLVYSHWRIKFNNVLKVPSKGGGTKEGSSKHHAFISLFPSPSSVKGLSPVLPSTVTLCSCLNHKHGRVPNKVG